MLSRRKYALTGLAAPALFIIVYLILSARRVTYYHATKAVSELGSVDAPFRWIWNVFGYVVPGILIAIFAVGLFQSMSRSNDRSLPLIGLVLSGLFMSLSGFFPADMENRRSITSIVHMVGSIGSYIFYLVSAFTSPKLMRQTSFWRSAAMPSLILVWGTVFFGGWYFVFPELPGIGQRITFSIYFIWIILLASKLWQYDSFK